MLVFIFDIDQTICKDTLGSTSKVNQFIQNLKGLIQEHDVQCYIVTARVLENRDEYDLLSFNVHPIIVKFFCELNKENPHRWLFYNNTMDHPVNESVKLLRNEEKSDICHNFIHSRGLDPTVFHFGMHKMIQIEKIMNKYPKYTEGVFFDDSSHNKAAHEFYKHYINPTLHSVRFTGGNDQPVFQ